MEKEEQDFVELLPTYEGIIFSGKRRLLQYYVEKVGYFIIPMNKGDGSVFKIQFDCLSSFYIINTYIPTLVMLIIGYLPFFFAEEDFYERITVAITSLLVEATFLTQLTSIVPKTSYMKMIDIWCVFCISALFSISILLTVINHLKVDDPPKTKKVKVVTVYRTKKMKTTFKDTNKKNYFTSQFFNDFGRIFYPFFIGLFVFGYIIIAINQRVRNRNLMEN